MTPGESLDQRIGAMEREIAFVRKGIDDVMAEKAHLEDRVNALEGRLIEEDAKDWCQPPGTTLMASSVAERLRRIERAAMGVAGLAWSPRMRSEIEAITAMNILRAALDGETK